MTCDTFVICQAHSINQILQPVTEVIISSSAEFNYFKRHFQDTKDVKCLNHNNMKQNHSLYNVLKILWFLFITHWLTSPVMLQSHRSLMNTYLTLSLPLGPEVFLSFPLLVLPLSASCIHCVNTDFQFSGASVLYIACSTDFFHPWAVSIFWYLSVVLCVWAGLQWTFDGK